MNAELYPKNLFSAWGYTVKRLLWVFHFLPRFILCIHFSLPFLLFNFFSAELRTHDFFALTFSLVFFLVLSKFNFLSNFLLLGGCVFKKRVYIFYMVNFLYCCASCYWRMHHFFATCSWIDSCFHKKTPSSNAFGHVEYFVLG